MKKCIAEMNFHSADHDERKHPHSRWLQHPRVITYIYLQYICVPLVLTRPHFR